MEAPQSVLPGSLLARTLPFSLTILRVWVRPFASRFGQEVCWEEEKEEEEWGFGIGKMPKEAWDSLLTVLFCLTCLGQLIAVGH